MRSFGAGVDCAGDEHFISDGQEDKPCDVAVIFEEVRKEL
jgi:hypothetical protein